jgi:hypothetical protein
VALDLNWDRTSPWIDAGGRRFPALPAIEGTDEDGARWWAAGIPFENRTALLLIVDEDPQGNADHAVVQLLLPAPGQRWVERLEAIPCKVVDDRIRPCAADNPELPEEFDWVLTDGWWATLDDAAELHRYAGLFGSLPVAR